LYFHARDEKFCGKKFKVFKRSEIIILESTMEIRKLKSPTIFLEGVVVMVNFTMNVTVPVFISGERRGLKNIR
jgi:hypothetical protein